MSTPALRLERLSVAYDHRPVLRGVSLTVEPGERVAIVGPNGAGKSTLLRAVLGLVPADDGRVEVFGAPIDRVRRRVAYVPQRSAVDWDFPVTAFDVVLMGRYVHLGWLRRPGPNDHVRARDALARLGIGNLANRQIGQLSGGQQQRVFLARALAQDADLFLLDEPFVGVDAATEEAIYRLLEELRREGRTTVVVLHDLVAARRHFDRVVLLNGRVVAAGPPRQVLTPSLLRQTYGGRLTALALLEQWGSEDH